MLQGLRAGTVRHGGVSLSILWGMRTWLDGVELPGQVGLLSTGHAILCVGRFSRLRQDGKLGSHFETAAYGTESAQESFTPWRRAHQ
jgi:hypothetical protein